MPVTEEIWIETAPPGAEAGALYHAVFAASIRLRPFADNAQWQWGWNAGALLEEALDRQRLFLEAQHPQDDLSLAGPEDRQTLALRCIRDPAEPHLGLSLLGKVCAPSADAARNGARAYWEETRSIFPYDYELAPATSRSDFMAVSGQSILDAPGCPGSLVELRRFEGVIAAGARRLFVLAHWPASSLANEQIWRALAGCPEPLLYTVCLRPAVLLDLERRALANLAGAARELAADDSLAPIWPEATYLAGLYSDRLTRLRHPYVMRVHLAAPASVPAGLIRVVSAALSHPAGTDPAMFGCQAIRIPVASLDRERQALRWLEPEDDPEPPLDARCAGLRHKVELREAHTAFRLPFLPKGGIPGLAFPSAEPRGQAGLEGQPADAGPW
jgi:hypothetical protein